MKNFKRIAICIPVLLFTGFLTTITGQNPDRQRTYKIWIETMDSRMIKGFLTDIDSSGITLSGDRNNLYADTYFVNADNVRLIKLRRRGSGIRGAGYGLLGGAAFGALLGAASGDDGRSCSTTQTTWGDLTWCSDGLTAGEKAAGGAIVGGFFGSIAGTAVGHIKRKFIIDGNLSMYYLKIPIIREYTGRIAAK